MTPLGSSYARINAKDTKQGEQPFIKKLYIKSFRFRKTP